MTSKLTTLLFSLINLTSAYTPLSDASLSLIPSGSSDFDPLSGALLSPILIPRVPGTPGSETAQHHFVNFFRTHLPDWTVQWHNSTATTPATGNKQVPFRNLIFRRDPPWATEGDVARLTLVAHYDSLYKPEGFIGAIDSAVPCALLLHVARSVEEALRRKWVGMGEGDGLGEEVGVQVVLLDGEEAWVTWTDEDSLYGARKGCWDGILTSNRALAESWAGEGNGAGTFSTQMESISLFVLLDLLGSANPTIPSYFAKTHWAYEHMATAERRLRKLGLLETKEAKPFLPDLQKKSYQFTMGYVLDDHVPFMERGVDVLHVIPTPFPPVWHTMDDDGAHLDISTIRDWAKIVTTFVAEWMDLDGLLPPLASAEKPNKGGHEKEEL
ncbi:peptidase family M28 [Immersiella caudata]|uniref:Peptide hydrolase n=1 Tax=Immersiella caudata TaxID=314043 RepID=A0AA39XEE6_9PEZI|nr:peptidase family M28 [Immersiella caudata]